MHEWTVEMMPLLAILNPLLREGGGRMAGRAGQAFSRSSGLALKPSPTLFDLNSDF